MRRARSRIMTPQDPGDWSKIRDAAAGRALRRGPYHRNQPPPAPQAPVFVRKDFPLLVLTSFIVIAPLARSMLQFQATCVAGQACLKAMRSAFATSEARSNESTLTMLAALEP